jgi:hypothetical protein
VIARDRVIGVQAEKIADSSKTKIFSPQRTQRTQRRRIKINTDYTESRI